MLILISCIHLQLRPLAIVVWTWWALLWYQYKEGRQSRRLLGKPSYCDWCRNTRCYVRWACACGRTNCDSMWGWCTFCYCCACENAAARCYSHCCDPVNANLSLVALDRVVASSTDRAWSTMFAGPVQRSFVVRMSMATPYGWCGEFWTFERVLNMLCMFLLMVDFATTTFCAQSCVFSWDVRYCFSHTLWCELSYSDVTMSMGWLMNVKEFDVSCLCAYSAKNRALLTMPHWLRAWCKQHSCLPSWCHGMVGYQSIPCWYEHLQSVLREFAVSRTSHVVCIMGLSLITVNGGTPSPLP